MGASLLRIQRETMQTRKLEDAQHEAAHIVVGITLGLRLRKAVICKDVVEGWVTEATCWFTSHGSALAHAIMCAAGVVWERAHGRESPIDYRHMLEELNVTGDVDGEVRTCLRLAEILLKNHGKAHKQVTMALMDRDLTDKDIRAIARGEKVQEMES